MNRSKDPSPFAWIFGGGLVLLGIAALVSFARKGNQVQQDDDVWARATPQNRTAGTDDTTDVDQMLDGHPS